MTAPAAVGPRCHCGKPVPRVEGKKARIYCSEACRSAMRRMLRKSATEAAPGKSGRLGKEATEFRGPQTATTDRAVPSASRDGKPGGATSGKTAEGTREERRAAAARARKAERYARRRTLWRISDDPSCRGCGRAVMDTDVGAVMAQTAEGYAVLLGVMKCARIWLCAVCSATIRAARVREINTALLAWLLLGGRAYLVTLTARHASHDRLADLMDALQGSRAGSPEEIAAARRAVADAKAACLAVRAEVAAEVDAARLAAGKGQKRAAMSQAREAGAPRIAEAERLVAEAGAALAASRRQAGAYQRLITGGVWAGDKREKSEAAKAGIRGRIGYLGMIRATEVTLGSGNGWHPHIHAIVLCGGRVAEGGKLSTFEPDDEAIREWEDHWRAVWTAHLRALNPRWTPSLDCERANCKCRGRGHAVDFKRLETAADVAQLGEYLVKTQDGKDPGSELARLDLKSAGHGMTPFELIGRIGDLMSGMDPDDPSIPGHGTLDQCLKWWREYEGAVKGRRAIEWTRGLRALFGVEGGDDQDDDADAVHDADATSGFRAGLRIAAKGWHAVTSRSLDLAVTELVEGTGGIDTAAVAELVAAAGAPLTVVALTPGEVEETYARMLATLDRRREEAKERRKAAEAAAGSASE